MIESRTRRGMILTVIFILGGMKRVFILHYEPGITSHLLGFRVAFLEIGISSDYYFIILKSRDMVELKEIVNAGVALGNNEYANLSEYTFHSKLYEITGNKTIVQFQSIIHPVMNFVKTNLRERVEAINIELEKKGKIVTHTDLLNFIKNKDEMGYRNAIEQHFYVYKKLIYDRAVLGEQNKGQSQ